MRASSSNLIRLEFPLAAAAQTEDREVVDVRAKADVVVDLRSQPLEIVVVEFSHVIALAADQMMVPLAAHPLERRVARAHVRLGDEAHVLQHRQRAIDRRDVDVWVLLLYALEDVRGREMTLRVSQRRQDHHPLGRHFVPRLAQDIDGLGFAAHATLGCCN